MQAVAHVPPEVRVINAWQTFTLSVMASMAELAVIAATTYEHAHDRLSTELWVGAVLVPALGPLIGRARGKLPSPTVLALGAILATVAQRVGKLVLPLALVGAWLLQGCGSASIPPSLVRDARKAASGMAEPLRKATPRLNAVGSVLAAACGEQPLIPAAQCDIAVPAFNEAAAQVAELQALLVQLDTVLAVIEAAQ
jgi:hypothetical protein